MGERSRSATLVAGLLLVVSSWSCIAAVPLRAQSPGELLRAGVVPRSIVVGRTESNHAPGEGPALPATAGEGAVESGIGDAFLSAAIPGLSQYRHGKRRAFLYFGAEAAFLYGWWNARSDARDLRDAYRDLAWQSARSAMPEPRRDGDFDYYETMSHFTRSGAFDTDPGASGIQPEDDVATFNGQVWALARAIFFEGGDPGPGTPQYEAALGFYRDRAVDAHLVWDWRGKEAARDEFTRLFGKSDDKDKDARVFAILVAGNHFLSALDAFISHRISAEAQRWLPVPSIGGGPAVRWTDELTVRLEWSLR